MKLETRHKKQIERWEAGTEYRSRWIERARKSKVRKICAHLIGGRMRVFYQRFGGGSRDRCIVALIVKHEKRRIKRDEHKMA